MEGMIATVLSTTLLVIFAGIVFMAWDTRISGKNSANSTLFYNGTSSILSLEKPFMVEILENSTDSSKVQTLGLFTLPDASKAKTSGSVTEEHAGSKYVLTIAYDEEIPGNNATKGKLTKTSMIFTMDYNATRGYWTLTDLTVDFEGTGNQSKAFSVKEKLNINPKGTGYTKATVDISCERDMSICAPKNLCWKCSDEVLAGVLSENTTTVSSLTMPGIKLQPIINGTAARFGNTWDCDPLIPLGLWVSLLLGFLLIVAIYWAVDMLTNLNTPNRFDDPKGKPISVPNTE